MNLAFLLHIYQPPIQDSKTLKKIADTCYVPLIKSIKNKLDLKLTLNIPLSLVYQLHVNKYDELLARIKALYEEEKIELTSTGAYHPLLTRLPANLQEKELILNEYGLGYYFGKDKGFEGEDALLIKNVNGVFPPEMAVNQQVIEQLDKMGYSWVVVDEVSIPTVTDGDMVYYFDRLKIKVVARNTKLSNILSFKRDTSIDDFVAEVLRLRQEGRDAVVALDGEYFGHHFDEGMYVFDKLITKLNELEINLMTVSELVLQARETKIENIHEATWGASKEHVDANDLYPMWHVQGNKIQDLLWKIYNRVRESEDITVPIANTSNISFETFPIWDLKKMDELTDIRMKNNLYRQILHLQSLNSDQFWWASNIEVGGVKMYSSKFIEAALDLYIKYAVVSENNDLEAYIKKIANEIKSQL